MTASFSLTPEDFSRLRRMIALRIRRKVGYLSWGFFLRVIIWFCIGSSLAIASRVARENPKLSIQIWLSVGLLLLAVLLVIVAPSIAFKFLGKKILSPRGAFLSAQTIELTNSALLVSSATGRTEVPWTGLLARDEDSANIYLFIDEMQALVLPRVAISSLLSELNAKTSHLSTVA